MTDAFDPGDTRENELALACCALEHGTDGCGQPPSVRRLLRDLEKEGLAEYSEKLGWRLTDAGKARSRALLRAARKTR